MEGNTSMSEASNIIQVLEHQLNKLTFNKKQICYKRPELIKLVQKEEDIEKGYFIQSPLVIQSKLNLMSVFLYYLSILKTLVQQCPMYLLLGGIIFQC